MEGRYEMEVGVAPQTATQFEMIFPPLFTSAYKSGGLFYCT